MNEIVHTVEKLTLEGYSANYISDYFSYGGVTLEPKEVSRIVNDLGIEKPGKKKVVRRHIKETCGKGSTLRSGSTGNRRVSRSSNMINSY